MEKHMNDQLQDETDVAHDDVERLKQVASKYGKFIALGVAVVALAASAGVLHRRRVAVKADEAAQLLTESRTTKDLETLLEEHSGSALVPVALMKSAKLYYDSANYNVAMEKYEEFIEKHPEHPMAAAAALGKTQCMEARGQVQDAMLDYIKFAGEHQDHYLVPQAAIGQARCLEQLGRLAEAQGVCENFVEANPESAWMPLAEEMAERLTKKIARAERREKQAAVE